MPNRYNINGFNSNFNRRGKSNGIFDINHIKEIREEINKLTEALANWDKLTKTADTNKNAKNFENLTEAIAKSIAIINSYNISLDKTTGILSEFYGPTGSGGLKTLQDQLNSVNSIVTGIEQANRTVLSRQVSDSAYTNRIQFSKWDNNKIGGLSNAIFNNRLDQYYSAKNSVTKNVIERYTQQGKFSRDNYKEIRNAINTETSQMLENSGFKGSVLGLNLAASTLNIAGEALKKAASTMFSIFKEGINRQSSIYEDTFHNISARTGMNRLGYKQFQLSTNTLLNAQGLNGSVGVYEAQEALSKLVDLGMNQEKATTAALDSVITNKIVPYLDTTSRDFNLINNRLDNRFVKDIRGINAYNADIAGNNYLTSDLLNKIIDMVQPMSDESIQNLAQSSSNFTAAMNYLMSEEGGNLSYDQAMNYWNQIYKQQNYSAQIMRNGTVAEKMNQIGYIERNVDLENINNLPLALAATIDTQRRIRTGPSYSTGNQLNNLVQNIADEALGFSRIEGLAIEKLQRAGVTGDTLLGITNGFNLDKYSEGEFTRLSSNETTTAKEIEKFWLSNKGTTLATINETLTKTSSTFINTIIGGISTLVGGKLISSIVKGFGLTPGTGIKTLIASNGGMVLGTVGAAAIPFIASAVSQGMADNAKQKAYNNRNSFVDELESVSGIGDVESASVIHSYADQLTAKSFGQKLGNAGKAFVQGLNILGKLNLLVGTDPITVNKDIWNEATIGTAVDNKTLRYMLVAFANSMLSAGNSPDIISQVLGTGININGIKTEAHLLYNENPDQFLSNLAKMEGNLIYKPFGPNGKKGNYNFSLENMRKWGTFRQGLTKVPYDEYPALLHAGETIMTASSTATMENMIQEFRNSQNQNYSLDAAIQNQTVQLLQKMDDIIHNMNLMTTTQSPINTASEKLRNNMLSLTSPLAFQN